MKIDNRTVLSTDMLRNDIGLRVQYTILIDWINKNGYHKDAKIKARVGAFGEYVCISMNADLETVIVESVESDQ